MMLRGFAPGILCTSTSSPHTKDVGISTMTYSSKHEQLQ
jgi:hypothetical protein